MGTGGSRAQHSKHARDFFRCWLARQGIHSDCNPSASRPGEVVGQRAFREILREYPNAEVAGKITLRQLLLHTSGLGDISDAATLKRRPVRCEIWRTSSLFWQRSRWIAPGFSNPLLERRMRRARRGHPSSEDDTLRALMSFQSRRKVGRHKHPRPLLRGTPSASNCTIGARGMICRRVRPLCG